MANAYFRPPPGSTAVEAAILEGMILPPAMRVHPSEIVKLCDELWNRLMEAQSNGTISKESVGAILSIVESGVGEIEKRAHHAPRPNEPFENRFGCWDVVSGDVWRVVLDIGGWGVTNPLDAGKNGFIFDVNQLIDAGAHYRMETFYDELIERLMKAGKRNPPGSDWARSLVKRVAKDSTLGGDDAKAYIRDYPRSHHGWPPKGDLLWDGPLPIVLAREAWVNGERVAAGQIVGDEMREFLHGVIRDNESATLDDAETTLTQMPEDDPFGIQDKEPYENELGELIRRFGRDYELVKLVGPPPA